MAAVPDVDIEGEKLPSITYSYFPRVLNSLAAIGMAAMMSFAFFNLKPLPYYDATFQVYCLLVATMTGLFLFGSVRLALPLREQRFVKLTLTMLSAPKNVYFQNNAEIPVEKIHGVAISFRYASYLSAARILFRTDYLMLKSNNFSTNADFHDFVEKLSIYRHAAIQK